MPEKTETTDVSPDLRNQLAKRLAVAGGLVAILLGMLAVFDHFSQPADERELQVFTQPVPVAPKKMVTQPVTPAEIVPEPTAEPLETAAVAPVAEAETPPPPVVAAEPAAEPARVPAATNRSAARTATPAKEPAVVPEMTSAPPIAPTPVDQPSRKPAPPTARVIESVPASSPAPLAPVTPAGAPRLFSGFVLQAGVFTSAQRAEELHAKLTLSGVPSQIETRVQVGPFRTRKEAAEAQARLHELGIDTILVAPKSAR